MYMMTQKNDQYTKVFSTSSEVHTDVMNVVTVKYSLQQTDKTVLH